MSITRFRRSLSRYSKPLLIAIAATFLVGGVFTSYGSFGPGGDQAEQGKGYIAKVNGEELSTKQFSDALLSWEKNMKNMTGREPAPSDIAGQKVQLLDQMISLSLKEQAAEERGMRVRRGEINAEIDRMVNQRIDQERQQVVAMEKSKKKLSRQEQDRKLEQLLRMFYNDKSLTIESHRKNLIKEAKANKDQIRASLLIQKLDQDLRRTVRMSDKELVESYRAVKASHILISTQMKQGEQAKRKADEILRSLRSGGDFAKLARENSDDPMTKNQGGAFPMELMSTQAYGVDPAVAKVIFALKPGQISDVIKTAAGYEIVKVDSEKSMLPPDFDAKKKQYMAEKLKAKQDQVANEFYDKIKRSAKVEVVEPSIKGYWLLSQIGAAMEKNGEAGRKKTMAEAAKAFEAALDKNNDPSDLYVLAQTYRATGETDKAIRVLEQRMEISYVVDGPDLRILLGDLYEMKKDIKRATEQYQKASEVGYPDHTIHQQLVYAFKRVGRADLAAKEEQMAKEMNPQQEPTAPMPASAPGAP